MSTPSSIRSGGWVRWAHLRKLSITAVLSGLLAIILRLWEALGSETIQHISGLWLSAALVAIGSFALVPESDMSFIAQRSVRRRRSAAVLVLLVTGLVAGLLLHAPVWGGFGLALVVRDVLGLLGAVLIVRSVASNTALWIIPLLAMASYSLARPEENPSLAHSLLNFLRVPASEPASWLPTLCFLGIGSFLYLGLAPQHSLNRRWIPRRSVPTGSSYGSPAAQIVSGVRRYGLLDASSLLAGLALAGVHVALLLSSASDWGSSPGDVIGSGAVIAMMILLPISAAIAVFLAQKHHRIGIRDWERLSPRGEHMVMAITVVRVTAVVVGALLVSLAAIWLLAAAGSTALRLAIRDTAEVLLPWLFLMGICVLVIVGTATVGWYLRPRWLPLTMFALYFVVLMIGTPDASNRAPTHIQTVDTSLSAVVCRGGGDGGNSATRTSEAGDSGRSQGGVQLCGDPSLANYMGITHDAINDAYSEWIDAGLDPQSLPARIGLVSTRAHGGYEIPVVELRGLRELSIPERLDASELRTQLGMRLGSNCFSRGMESADTPHSAQEYLNNLDLIREDPAAATAAVSRETECFPQLF